MTEPNKQTSGAVPTQTADKPATWRICDNPTAWYPMVVDSEGLPIAQVISTNHEKAVRLGRLIAMAPELLAALQTAEMALLGVVRPNEIVLNALAKGRAAIAKAGGAK